jgi:hypothetical protein
MFESDLEAFERQFGDALMNSGDADVSVLDAALARALAVHRNTAVKAAQDALAANYPILRALCGDEVFTAWAIDFIRRSAPREARLNAFGEGFADFLLGYEPARQLPYVADVAVVERLVTEALFATDAEPLTPVELVGRYQAGGAVALHPATRFAQLSSPAVGIWLAHHSARPDAFDMIDWSAEAVLVTRPIGNVEVQRLSAGALALLSACAAGQGMDAAVTAASDAGEEPAPLIAALTEAGAFV